jgi:uncharacterized protein YcbK (DUF882 family)
MKLTETSNEAHRKYLRNELKNLDRVIRSWERRNRMDKAEPHRATYLNLVKELEDV